MFLNGPVKLLGSAVLKWFAVCKETLRSDECQSFSDTEKNGHPNLLMIENNHHHSIVSYDYNIFHSFHKLKANKLFLIA